MNDNVRDHFCSLDRAPRQTVVIALENFTIIIQSQDYLYLYILDVTQHLHVRLNTCRGFGYKFILNEASPYCILKMR